MWRLVTTFLYFGPFGFTFLFNLIFTYRYCRMLEEGSFRGRTPDFLFMFLFGAGLMVLIAFFVNLLFLGHAFTIMLVYVWSRRNPFVRMNFFGLLNFQAPYLPWVLLAFSLLLGNSVLVVRPSSLPPDLLCHPSSRTCGPLTSLPSSPACQGDPRPLLRQQPPHRDPRCRSPGHTC